MDGSELRGREPFSDYVGTTIRVALFLQSTPLYTKLRTPLPDHFESVRPEALELTCATCKVDRPFRGDRRNCGGSGVGFPPPPTRVSGIRHFSFNCTGCQSEKVDYWIQVSYQNEEWIQKVGQCPIWIAQISAEMEKELGADAEIYKKAIRSMNEGYGIGACAYLRRLLEKHINPLLQLLHDSKAEQGAKPEELQSILDAIRAKDFSTKTKFAADIAPAAVLIEGTIHSGRFTND